MIVACAGLCNLAALAGCYFFLKLRFIFNCPPVLTEFFLVQAGHMQRIVRCINLLELNPLSLKIQDSLINHYDHKLLFD